MQHKGYPTPPSLHPGIPQSGDRQAQYHDNSGWTYGRGKNTLERMEDDKYNQNRQVNIFWPFPDRGEWALGKFLAENFTQTQIDAFLRLAWFDDKPKPSFSSARELLDWIDILPSGPLWQVMELEVEGYGVGRKIELIYRDGLEVVESLFGNPVFAQHMSYDPLKIWEASGPEYGEWFTASEATRIQNSLPHGATLIPIIAASDKTPVTRQTGGLEMHPLFLTIGNIDSDVRMKATAHAWRCVAFMPIVKFETHPDYQTILQSRLWHRCVDIVFGKLKHVANSGAFITDPFGAIRYCFTPLVAWTADLPEQQMIACVSKNASPVTLATLKQFGDPTPHLPRTKSHTLDLIHSISDDPWNLDRYQKACKELLLLGVHLPFWRDWLHSDPSIFLVPEILHTLHKLFFDHILAWCKEVVGKDELDARYKAHHKRIGVRHFTSGVSHVKQMTGREHRDIQRTIVAMIAGAAPQGVVSAIRALVDFIYHAQRPVQTEASVQRMDASLAEFHATKDAIITAGARRGKNDIKENFYIPKLEILQSFASAARNSGAPMQYTADVTERLLITHCKNTFARTNRQKDYAEQIARRLNREENLLQADIYLLLREHNEPLMNAAQEEESYIRDTDPTFAWSARVAPEEQHRFNAPRPIRNHFVKGFLSDNTKAALSVATSADRSKLTFAQAAELYSLPDFLPMLKDYVLRCSENDDTIRILETFNTLKVWYKFRIQQYSSSRPSLILPSQAVQAFPPSAQFPFGNCDAVLLNADEQSVHNPGYCVAEVRAVFQFMPSRRSGDVLPDFLSIPLVYIRPFNNVGEKDATKLQILEKALVPGVPPSLPMHRLGLVVPLTEVTHAVDLVPVFGQAADRTVTAATSQEHYNHFYLNFYADKEIFDDMGWGEEGEE